MEEERLDLVLGIALSDYPLAGAGGRGVRQGP